MTKRFDIPEDTLRHSLKTGQIKKYKIGTLVRIDPQELVNASERK